LGTYFHLERKVVQANMQAKSWTDEVEELKKKISQMETDHEEQIYSLKQDLANFEEESNELMAEYQASEQHLLIKLEEAEKIRQKLDQKMYDNEQCIEELLEERKSKAEDLRSSSAGIREQSMKNSSQVQDLSSEVEGLLQNALFEKMKIAEFLGELKIRSPRANSKKDGKGDAYLHSFDSPKHSNLKLMESLALDESMPTIEVPTTEDDTRNTAAKLASENDATLTLENPKHISTSTPNIEIPTTDCAQQSPSANFALKHDAALTLKKPKHISGLSWSQSEGGQDETFEQESIHSLNEYNAIDEEISKSLLRSLHEMEELEKDISKAQKMHRGSRT